MKADDGCRLHLRGAGFTDRSAPTFCALLHRIRSFGRNVSVLILYQYLDIAIMNLIVSIG